jgi:NAD dependent epimerase/dehydratase family enzyme
MKNKKIVIPGGSGFIGQALAEYFGKENEIVILGRQSKKSENNLYKEARHSNANHNTRYVKWDGRNIEETWSGEIDGADLVINLAGKTVNCRYRRKQKQEILDSRTSTTRIIGEAIRQASHPPSVWINAASSTIYKNSVDRPNDEDTGVISALKAENMPFNLIDRLRFKLKKGATALFHGKKSNAYKSYDLDFSVQVCQQWEKTFFDQELSRTRKIALRTAITLGKGGVIIPYLNLCKFGLGGKHGNGRQMYSWVHIEDLARMIEWLYENNKAEGIYNCVAPNVVSNDSFMKTLRQVTGNDIGLPAPAWMLELGSFLIGTETELMLKSRWVIPARALNERFEFKYPFLKPALSQIVAGLPRSRYRFL